MKMIHDEEDFPEDWRNKCFSPIEIDILCDNLSKELNLEDHLQYQENFQRIFWNQIHYVNDIYKSHFARYTGELDKIRMSMSSKATVDQIISEELNEPLIHESNKRKENREKEKKALINLWYNLSTLKEYGLINYSAFLKSLKTKTPAILDSEAFTMAMTSQIQELDFYQMNHINEYIYQIESIYANHFCDGDLRITRKQLKKKRNHHPDWIAFYFGMRLGLNIILLVWFLWDSLIDKSKHQNLWQSPMMFLYRGIGVLILLVWLWGGNLFLFRYYSIDYVSIFEMKQIASISYMRIWQTASDMTTIYLVNVILYYKLIRKDIHLNRLEPSIIPLILFVYISMKCIFPWQYRKEFWFSFFCVISSPFSKVNFKDAYLGDVLTSLIRVLADIAWSTCYFISGDFNSQDRNRIIHDTCGPESSFSIIVIPLLHALPLWWRFCQNVRCYHDTHQRFPHIANALKYAFAQSVILFAIFHPSIKHIDHGLQTYQICWIIAFILTTLYQFFWDVRMDWNLFTGDPKHPLLRSQLMFNSTFIYYLGIGIDFIMRFFWTLSLIPQNNKFPIIHLQTYLSPFIAAGEICRRSIWGCFRVENEHIKLIKKKKYHNQIHYKQQMSEEIGSRKAFGWRVLGELCLIVGLVVGVSIWEAFSKSTQ